MEKWLPVPGYASYEVSDHGRVRSLDRPGHPGRVRRPGPGTYLTVSLSVDGKLRTRYIHELVAAAFLGPRPDRMDVCHGPGGKHDNRDAVAAGVTQYAQRTVDKYGHPLTDADVYIERSGIGADGQMKYRRRCKICKADAQRARNKRKRSIA